jgi:hypothetical protein
MSRVAWWLFCRPPIPPIPGRHRWTNAVQCHSDEHSCKHEQRRCTQQDMHNRLRYQCMYPVETPLVIKVRLGRCCNNAQASTQKVVLKVGKPLLAHSVQEPTDDDSSLEHAPAGIHRGNVQFLYLLDARPPSHGLTCCAVLCKRFTYGLVSGLAGQRRQRYSSKGGRIAGQPCVGLSGKVEARLQTAHGIRAQHTVNSSHWRQQHLYMWRGMINAAMQYQQDRYTVIGDIGTVVTA